MRKNVNRILLRNTVTRKLPLDYVIIKITLMTLSNCPQLHSKNRRPLQIASS